MADKKVIVVAGATGAQGGSLVRAILNDAEGGFEARAITRDASSDKAKQLAELGADVVEADVADLESLKKAFAGAYGAYCVTFFWDHYSPETELEHANKLATAAKDANLKHVIWSTLEDTRNWVPLDDDRMPTLMERYKVPHFDAKGEANHFFANLGVPTTFLLTSFYWENFIYFGSGPQRGPDGKLAVTFPMGDKKLASIGVEDIGKCAYGIFKKGLEYVGKTVAISGEQPTGQQIADALSRALGKEVAYNDVPPEVYRGFGFPGAEDLGNMFQFKRDFNDYFCTVRDPAIARELNPELQTLDVWLSRYKHLIPID
jgi:uncharacterized protein YbjT (DUF2867 family)